MCSDCREEAQRWAEIEEAEEAAAKGLREPGSDRYFRGWTGGESARTQNGSDGVAGSSVKSRSEKSPTEQGRAAAEEDQAQYGRYAKALEEARRTYEAQSKKLAEDYHAKVKATEMQYMARGVVINSQCCGLVELHGLGFMMERDLIRKVEDYARSMRKGFIYATVVPKAQPTEFKHMLDNGYAVLATFYNPNTGNTVHLLGKDINEESRNRHMRPDPDLKG